MFPKALEDNTVSIIKSAVGIYYQYRININRNIFPSDIHHIEIHVENELQKISFKKYSNGRLKKLNMYGPKSKIFFLSLPKKIEDLGFTKTRYKIQKSKDKDTYFFITVKDKIDETKD